MKIWNMVLIACCLYADSSQKDKILPKCLYVWSGQNSQDEPLGIGNSFYNFFQW